MVWVIHVEIAGQRQAERFLLTAGNPDKPREVTVGRPPTKADARPDIVVPEKSVSKIHAVLHVSTDSDDGSAGNRLIITDRSRYGTTINGQKMELGGSQQLVAGDMVQLAPRALLIVEELPVVVAVHPQHPHLADVREAAARAGARLAHAYEKGATTQVLHGPGDVAWSALVQGALRSLPFAGLDWLCDIASAGLLTNALPDPPPISELMVMGEPATGRSTTRVRLPPPCGGGAWRGLLAGATFGYSASWQDEGLAALLTELGGSVVERPQSQGSSGGAAVVVLAEGGGARHGSLGAEELLTAILTLDAGGVRQLIAAAAGAVASGSGRQAAPAAAPPGGEASAGQADSDSDITQAAEEDEEAAEARGGEVVEQRPGPGPGPGPGASTGQGVGLGLRSHGRAEPSTLLPATVPSRSFNARVGAGARGVGPPPPAAGSAREAAMQEAGGWLVAARRPEDANTQAATAAAADGSELSPENQVAHEDAPPTKRRRLTATQPGSGRPAAAAAAAPAPSAAAAASTATGAAHQVSLASRLAAPPPATTSAKPLLSSPVPTVHEPEQEAPWMTQNPQGHGGGASRRSGAGLRGAAIVVREDPSPPTTAPPAPVLAPAGKGKGKGGKAGGGGMDDLDLAMATRSVHEEPPVLDASAQVVMEADLFAPTPEQLPQSRCRSGSAEPLPHASAGADGGYDGGPATALVDADLPDFKQFRKQGAQLPPVPVAQPLPVFLVDNFQRTEEAEAFLRMEEERATNKRRADEMFKSAEVASKKPPRAPRKA